MKSLKIKIFVLFVILLLSIQSITFWTLYSVNKNQEFSEINNRLDSAKLIFTELFQKRIEYLSAFSETVAKDYGLKEIFEDDTRSLLIALNNHRKRIDADLAMSISSKGIITGQLQRDFIVKQTTSSKKNTTDTNKDTNIKVRKGFELGSKFRYPHWFQSNQNSHFYTIENSLYQLSMSAVNVGSKTIGWIAFGFEIDRRLADEFKNITNLQTDFILNTDKGHLVLASSENKKDHKSQIALANLIQKNKTPTKYIATHVLITEFDNQELGVYMYDLRSNIVSVLQKQWLQLLLLTGLTLFSSLVGAYLIAISISNPIKRLVDQAKMIASGRYQKNIEFKEKNEIGQLAGEFNHMQSAILQREKTITHAANHDPLTNLPNKNKLNETLTHLIQQKIPIIALHINLRRLKDVNATLGYDIGDEVIKEAAFRLLRLLEINCIQLLVHLGADEFILIAKGTDVNKAINQVDKRLEAIFIFNNISLQLQARIGVSVSPKDTIDPVKLLQMADTALHHTRNTNSLVQVYKSELDVNTTEQLNLIHELKLAIPANELTLHFQPKLCLKTWEITHTEALVRWNHPKLGMISPDNFITIAEKTSQIKALTRWVFAAAVMQSRQWKAIGLNINIAINISAENLKEPDFYEFICQSIIRADIDPANITLEITESSVVDNPKSATNLLSQFKRHGIKISIDDYGTGYSSLTQLKQLPVHELKIDKSFIQNLEHEDDDQIIVRSTIDLAHNMGLHVVAEGIEDEFSLTWLAEHKCNFAQGYFISKPKPAIELTPWLLNPPQFNEYEAHKRNAAR